jgi:hypothetical protein
VFAEKNGKKNIRVSSTDARNNQCQLTAALFHADTSDTVFEELQAIRKTVETADRKSVV